MVAPLTNTRRRPLLEAVPSINWAHPFSKGLIGCWVPGPFGNGAVPNLVSPGSGDLTIRTGGIVNGKTMDGPGLDMSPTGNINLASANLPKQFQVPSSVSLFVRGKWTGYPTANLSASLIAVLYNAAPFIAYGLTTSGSTSFGGVVNAVSLNFDQGSTTFDNDFGGTVALTNGAMFTAGATIGSTLNSWRLYTNGVDNTNSNSGFTPSFNHYSLSPTISMGSGVAGRTGAAIVTVAYIWNRTFTAQTHRYLDANPYALLTWPTDLVYDPQPSPAAAPTPTLPSSISVLWPLSIGIGASAARSIIHNPKLTRRGALLGRWRQD